MAEESKNTLKFDPSAIGSTGLRAYGGYVTEEFLPELRFQQGARKYREMADNDPIVGAVLFAVTMLIRQAKWRVQAKDDTAEAEEAKAFFESVMDDMATPWSDVMAEICTMFIYGYAPLEIIWQRRDGKAGEEGKHTSKHDDGHIGLRLLSLRSQHTIIRWDIDLDDGNIMGVWQQPIDRSMVCIPAEKMLLFRTTSERSNPEGRSLLRNAYRPWFFKKRIEEIEGVGLERDLAGLPVAMIPSNYFDASADGQERAVLAAWQTMVKNVRRDQQEGILIPSDRDASGNLLFDFKLMSTGGARQFDTTKVIDRYNRAIATSVLADFIFLGQQSVGSFALSSDKTSLFATAMGAFMTNIAETINRSLIPRLWKLNGMDPELMPKLVPGDLETPNLGELGEFIQTLAGSGAQLFPDRELENHLREIAGLPLQAEDGADFVESPQGNPGDEETPQEAPQRAA